MMILQNNCNPIYIGCMNWSNLGQDLNNHSHTGNQSFSSNGKNILSDKYLKEKQEGDSFMAAMK